jgi:hypothetical protein
MSPSIKPWAGHKGLQETDTQNITHHRKNNNAPGNPLTFYERLLLCRLMVSGNPVKYGYFTDPRNKLIYSYLAYLQKQEYMPGVNSLARYLDECGVLDRAGGAAYVRSVFQGIPQGVSA